MAEQQYAAGDLCAAFGLQVQQVSYLGTGSFGETWRLRRQTGESAVKIMYQDGYSDEYLNREIDGLNRVNHAGVVKLRSRGTVSINGQSRPYLEFEYISGLDLAAFMEAMTTVSAGDVERFLVGLLDAVGAMHEVTIVHRDIKPANIILRDGDIGKPTVLDLGLAKAIDASSITVYPTLIGTPAYAAPEQLRGERAKTFADLWAIGVVTAELAIGRHPFYVVGTSLSRDSAINLLRSPPELSELDDKVRTVVRKLLSFETYRRGKAQSALRSLRG